MQYTRTTTKRHHYYSRWTLQTAKIVFNISWLICLANYSSNAQRVNCYITDVINAKTFQTSPYCESLTNNIKVYGTNFFKITPNKEFDKIFNIQKSLKKEHLFKVIIDRIGFQTLKRLKINFLLLSRLHLKKNGYPKDELIMILVTINENGLHSSYFKIDITKDSKDETRIDNTIKNIFTHSYDDPGLVYFATRKELVKKGILVKKGFFLFRIFKRRVFNYEAKLELSNKIKVDRRNEIILPPKDYNFKAVNKRKIYPPRSGYVIEKSHVKRIRINSPSSFWRYTNIAIIEVQKIKN